MDMIPGDGDDGLTGTILIESKSYEATNKSMKSVSLTPIHEFTIQQAIEMILNQGLDRYNFTEDEEGCRFWIYTLIQDFAKEGWIAEECREQVKEVLSFYWVYPEGNVTRPMEEGTFY